MDMLTFVTCERRNLPRTDVDKIRIFSEGLKLGATSASMSDTANILINDWCVD